MNINPNILTNIKTAVKGLDKETRQLLFLKRNAKAEIIRIFSELYKEKREILPNYSLIFRAFVCCPISKIRVVLLGQDPYPREQDAMGLSFSVPDGRRIPPSLNAIFNLLGCKGRSGNLEDWAAQGMLLLNAALTTVNFVSGAHINLWEKYTSIIMRKISKIYPGTIFIFLGKEAQKKRQFIRGDCHVFEWGHPSPLNKINNTDNPMAFKFCDVFERANKLLNPPIMWVLQEKVKNDELLEIKNDDSVKISDFKSFKTYFFKRYMVDSKFRENFMTEKMRELIIANETSQKKGRKKNKLLVERDIIWNEIKNADVSLRDKEYSDMILYVKGEYEREKKLFEGCSTKIVDDDRAPDRDMFIREVVNLVNGRINNFDFICDDPVNSDALWVFTDGAASKNGKPDSLASYGFCIYDFNDALDCGSVAKKIIGDSDNLIDKLKCDKHILFGLKQVGYDVLNIGSTNNMGELSAIMIALRSLFESGKYTEKRIYIITDSKYSMQMICGRVQWEKYPDNYKNLDLIRPATKYFRSLTGAVFIRVRSHTKIKNSFNNIKRFIWQGNFIADYLATKKLSYH